MKKAVIVTAILCVMLLAGCATSKWAGVPRQQVNAWRAIGVPPHEAKQYMANGFTAMDAQPWIQMGIKDPDIAIAWHRAGFSCRETSAWVNKGFTLQQAIEFRKKGLTVKD